MSVPFSADLMIMARYYVKIIIVGDIRMAFIELRNVYKTYSNGVAALADVTLDINRGEFVFLIGETGSGKSTLNKLLYREEKVTKGNVFVGGVNVSKLKNNNVYKLRRKVGVVFQDFKLLPKLTVYENVAYPLESYGYKIIRPGEERG